MLLKFPTEGTIELSMAAEIFAEAIARIEANGTLNVTSVQPKCELSILWIYYYCMVSWYLVLDAVQAGRTFMFNLS